MAENNSRFISKATGPKYSGGSSEYSGRSCKTKKSKEVGHAEITKYHVNVDFEWRELVVWGRRGLY